MILKVLFFVRQQVKFLLKSYKAYLEPLMANMNDNFVFSRFSPKQSNSLNNIWNKRV